MAIVNNVSTEFGDVIRIQSGIPVVGLISLTSFIDNTEGEDETKYFKKMFRYSTNGGMTFSDWMDLTLINIQNIALTKYDNFVIDYTYAHKGVDGELTFNCLTINGEIESSPYPHYDNSFFAKYQNVDSPCTIAWAINVLEKIYAKGLLPDYITRGESNSESLDDDFVAFWYTLTHFFAIIVCFARKFENIKENELFLEKFIQTKGLYVSPLTGYEDLVYLLENWVSELKKRGTLKIVQSKTNGNNIDGELLRIIGWSSLSEFIFGYAKPHEIGWNIGNSSPMYKNVNTIYELTKAYEKTTEIIDKAKYPITENSNISVNNGYFEIAPNSGQTGIGGNINYKILVSPNLDYEIAFRLIMPTTSDIFSFGIDCYDSVLNTTTPANDIYGTPTTWFLHNTTVQKANQEYWVRGILFNKNRTFSINNQKLNIGIGNNLIMQNNTKYIIPKIYVSNNSGTVKITDIKIRPLNLDFSKGFLGAKNFLINYFENNSAEYSNNELIELIKRFLLSYNTVYKAIII